MLKSLLLFAAVVLLVFRPYPAPARAPQPLGQAAGAKKPSGDSMAKAKKVYDFDCALCHGATGDGKTDLAKDMQLTLLDWTDPKALASQSDQALFDTIRNGKGKMPPEDAGRANNDEIHNLVLYIRKFAKEQQGAPTDQPAAPAPAATAPSR